ncbi:uncharacterized protein LOC133135094 [Conger conger]|uniref:uncharacterized protein LOC133135094 n=1 Tax=Conger conger TaxID=82655 RepID=UPI002A59837D|nr:uncharacterized protein LOC133135094 [Conger conger]
MSKSHKAMGDGEWLARLQRFASSGVWPSGEGNRPAPRQKRWHKLYQKGHPPAKVDAAASTSAVGATSSTIAVSASTSAEDVTHSTSTVGTALGRGTPLCSPVNRPKMSISMFEKSRFGGSHVAAARPNWNVQRKPTQTPPIPATSTSTSDPQPSPALRPIIQPSSSFFLPPATDTTTPQTPPIPSTSTSDPQPSPALRPIIQPSSSFFLPPATDNTPADPVELPLLWPQTMLQQDRKWVAEALFWANSKGKLELKDSLQLWYHPPPPTVLYHQAPTPDRFFSHRLLVWMPYRLWKVRLQCTSPACAGHQLCGGGLHRRVRQVLDIDNHYNMVTETLICTRCRSSYLSWGHTVLQQLDLAHRSEFRVILTRKLACDIRVIRLLRERTLGNGPVRLIGQLRENHSEEWLQRVSRYTSECMGFLNKPGLQQLTFQEPPPPVPVPNYKWLLTVYSKDILTRLEDIKAALTSTYGSTLKMDSTKKITKKLSGPAKGTAQWLTSVGNEIGQVLISVLTADEGGGIDAMTAGLVERYRRAGVAPPTLLYVDSHCCKEAGDTKLKQRFSGWPNLIIRLDIWHFIRRLAGGVTTDAHQLYPIFMARLSACIFEWDAGDLAQLRRAKKEQLTQEGWPVLMDAEVDKHISKAELALHCKRRTRGTDNTISLVDMLIGELIGDKGKDSMGVLLFDTVRMMHLWRVQKRHVGCIQDPPNVQLYTETGTVTKGGIALKTYRCARGSTSLESFHCHLARFIPGNSANSLNFQIYLLEGIFRWNKDRAAAALAGGGNSPLRTYTGELVYAVNTNYTALFGRKLVPQFSPPAVHTGELIGVQYLLRQSKQPLEDMTPGSDRTSELLEDLDIEEQGEEDEGFVDTLGEEAIVESLVPPVAPDAAQPPSAPPLVSTQLPSAQGPPAPVLLPAAQLPSAQGPPAPVMLPSAQGPPAPVMLPSAQGPPAPVMLPDAQLPSAQGPPAPVMLPSAQLPSAQGPPAPVLLPSAQGPPAPVMLPSAQGPPAPVLPAAQLPSAQGPPAPVMLPSAQLPSAQGPPAPQR